MILKSDENAETIQYSALKTPAVIWFTGLSGAGKTTLAEALKNKLSEQNIISVLLDGDDIRKGLNSDLGFSDADRKENIRRITEIAALLFKNGITVIVAAISPFRIDRDQARTRFPSDRFFEIYLNTPFNVCAERDVKGLYRKAFEGEIKDFTGIKSDYQPPLHPELTIDTSVNPVNDCLEQLYNILS